MKHSLDSMKMSDKDAAILVVAIVITYNPHEEKLLDLLRALQPQVGHMIVMDNASQANISSIVGGLGFSNSEVLRMPTNVGIASAQNAGIERAILLGASHVLLSDQDSLPTVNMVDELLSAILRSSRTLPLKKIAAVGPATIDSRSGKLASFIVENDGLPHRWKFPKDTNEIPAQIEVGFLIASGTLIPTAVLRDIGMMRASYFIDHVDTEWCFRAKAVGYILLGIPAARLQHTLGDTVKQIWFFGTRQVMYHTPQRDYYMFRNTLLMLRDTHMSLIWKLHFIFRLFQFSAYFLIFAEHRKQRFSCMLKGLLHGYFGVSGPLISSK
jgi:rhamnosyltransferase